MLSALKTACCQVVQVPWSPVIHSCWYFCLLHRQTYLMGWVMEKNTSPKDTLRIKSISIFFIQCSQTTLWMRWKPICFLVQEEWGSLWHLIEGPMGYTDAPTGLEFVSRFWCSNTISVVLPKSLWCGVVLSTLCKGGTKIQIDEVIHQSHPAGRKNKARQCWSPRCPACQCVLFTMVLGFLFYPNPAIKALFLIHQKNNLGVCTRHFRLLLYKFMTYFGTVRHSLRLDGRFGFTKNMTYLPNTSCESR